MLPLQHEISPIYFFIAGKPFLTYFNIQILAELDITSSYFIFPYITNKDFEARIFSYPHNAT